MKRLLSREEAFTGLEAAIVLIAFVVVAAVFSYVVLGAGFFTTQKTQAVIQGGVQQASSSMQILGNIYGLDMTQLHTPGTGGTQIDYLNFTIGLAPGAMPIDFTKVSMVIYNHTTRNQINQTVPNLAFTEPPPGSGSSNWTIASISNWIPGSSPTYLQGTEQFNIVVHLSDSIASIAPNDQFTLEIRPAIGPSLVITRTAPASFYGVNALY